MSNEENQLYKSAIQNINIMRCPECLGCYIGLGCITNNKGYFKVSLLCGSCDYGITNDDWFDSFEDALADVHSKRISQSIKLHGVINYDGYGDFK